MAVEGVAGRVEGHVLRQAHGKRVARYGHHAARFAVDHRDRAAPIALPRNQPVAQAVADGVTAGIALGEHGDGARLRLCDREPVQEVGIDRRAVADVGLIADLDRVRIHARRAHHGNDGQVLAAGEIEIALVVGGTTEDRAGAIVHEHEVGDIERQRAAGGKRMPDPDSRIEAALACRLDVALADASQVALGDERRERGIGFGERCRQRVIGRERTEGCTEQRIGTGGEDLQRLVAPLEGE